MVSFFQNMQKEDPRIKVFIYPKSPRTGEPYRDSVIKQTKSKIICYCSHDDLWLPDHVEVMEDALKKYHFAHALPVYMFLPDEITDENTLFGDIHWTNVDAEMVKKMQGGFGLTFAAHTRKCYFKLKEGWVTTPFKDIGTDQYMWIKFLTAFEKHWKATNRLTALNFPQATRKDWSEQQRDEELQRYFKKIQDPLFLKQLEKNASYLFRVEWWDGFSLLEKTREYNWRWCSSQGTMIINNHSNKDKLFTISALFFTGYPELSNLMIESTPVNENLQINNSGYIYEKEIVVPPGKNVIKFSCDAKRVDAPADPRYLVFCTRNFKLIERE
jgi:hypothetical protein